jgi:cell division protein FtsW (lipid II flippase)
VGVALLLLPFAPAVGRVVNGSRIWVGLGPISFQPGEFAKILLALFSAAYLVERRARKMSACRFCSSPCSW